MKKFFPNLMEWKTAAALLFTGSVILYAVIASILGQTSLQLSVIFSILLISALGTFIQFLAFTDRIIKNLRYTIRMIIFVIPFFAVLAANAYFFNWFPAEPGMWITFTAIFLTVFVIMTIGFEIYYRVMGKKYDGLLGQYRKQKEATKSNNQQL